MLLKSSIYNCSELKFMSSAAQQLHSHSIAHNNFFLSFAVLFLMFVVARLPINWYINETHNSLHTFYIVSSALWQPAPASNDDWWKSCQLKAEDLSEASELNDPLSGSVNWAFHSQLWIKLSPSRAEPSGFHLVWIFNLHWLLSRDFRSFKEHM